MTPNQVILRIKTLAGDHKQIRNVYEGQVSEFLTDKTTLYPSAFLQPTTGNISTLKKTVMIGFRLFLLDLANVSTDANANTLEIQSDMTLVAMDLIAQMNRSEFNDWQLSADNAMQWLQENDNDMTAGVYIDFTIQSPFSQNVCQVPSSFDGYSSITNDMKLVYDETYITTGTEGSTLTIPAIAGKRIMLVTRENGVVYKVTNLPGSAEYTFDGTLIQLGTPVVNPGERFLFLYRSI